MLSDRFEELSPYFLAESYINEFSIGKVYNWFFSFSFFILVCSGGPIIDKTTGRKTTLKTKL